MKMNIKYTVALQILCIFELYKNEKITSQFISNKTGVESSTIRYVMLDLKKANYISSKPGPGSATLSTPLNKISLYDVYEAVCDSNESVLSFYPLPATTSSVDIAMNDTLQSHFDIYKTMVFDNMKSIKLDSICNEIIDTSAT